MDAERDLDYQRPQGLQKTTHVRNRRCKFRSFLTADLDIIRTPCCAVAGAGDDFLTEMRYPKIRISSVCHLITMETKFYDQRLHWYIYLQHFGN